MLKVWVQVWELHSLCVGPARHTACQSREIHATLRWWQILYHHVFHDLMAVSCFSLLFLVKWLLWWGIRKAVMINVGPIGHYAKYILAPSNKDRVPDVGTGFILQHSRSCYWASSGPGTIGRAGEYCSGIESKSLPSGSWEYYNRYIYIYTYTRMSGGHGC